MTARKILMCISLAMLIVAVIFVFCALSCPTCGKVIYIGTFEFGPDLWRACYAVYVIAMATLFGASFFVKDRK